MNTTDYTEQAEQFLTRNGLRMRITLSDSKPAPWTPAGHHYRVTISGKARRITFDFFGSIADAQSGTAPDEYSVLACISSDAYCPDTFADWCAEFGYDEDSIKIKQTYRRHAAFADRLQAFFTPAELEQLSEIN